MDECALASPIEVRRILNIELRGALVETAATTEVSVACGDGATAQIAAHDPESGRTLERSVALATAAPLARARLLALSIAELALTLEREREATPPPKPASPPPAAPKPPEISPPTAHTPLTKEPRRLQLSAVGAGHGFFAGSGFLAGGGLRIAQDLTRHYFGWSSDVSAEHGAATVTAGIVNVDVLSVEASLFFSRHWRKLGIRIGAGARGGAVHLAGTPATSSVRGSTVWGGWVGPLGRASLVVTPTRRFVIELGLDGGYVLVPVAGLVDGARKVAIDGGWVGFSVALGAFL
jgi:hypothetical protein